jgi:hypothetical protein
MKVKQWGRIRTDDWQVEKFTDEKDVARFLQDLSPEQQQLAKVTVLVVKESALAYNNPHDFYWHVFYPLRKEV